MPLDHPYNRTPVWVVNNQKCYKLAIQMPTDKQHFQDLFRIGNAK